MGGASVQADADRQIAGESLMGRIMFDTSVFISHASTVPTAHLRAIINQIDLYQATLTAHEIRQAVKDYQHDIAALGAPQPPTIERCLDAYRSFETFSDEHWDELEPTMVEEIAVLHNLCDVDDA
jgi:hypothetical protein